jgi:hypothetical protein
MRAPAKFFGGPWHGRTLEVTPPSPEVRVPIPARGGGYTTGIYRARCQAIADSAETPPILYDFEEDEKHSR